MKSLYTIELNLDDDYANNCAYHVDNFIKTITRNIQHAETGQATNRWVIIGLEKSFEEAIERSKEIQKMLCIRNDKKPYGISELLEKIANKHNDKPICPYHL